MPARRALIVAPLYDGNWLPPLVGGPTLVDQITPLLLDHGGYDVKPLTGIVRKQELRSKMSSFFDTDGELLFYFYGHGCLRPPGVGVLATSDAQKEDEGIPMAEVMQWAHVSCAREVVLLLDCCHAGAVTALTGEVIGTESQSIYRQAGRAVLAACAAHQQGWEAKTDEQKTLGAFSFHVLRGLRGFARLPAQTRVRASVLGSYVTEVFTQWRQTPLLVTCETGDRACVITRGFPVETNAAAPRLPPLIIGVPFRPSATFVGRSAELDLLKSMLLAPAQRVALSATVEGLGGIGKTELVLQLVHDADILAAFSTVIWLDAAGPLPPQWAQVAQRLKMPSIPEDPDRLVAEVGDALRARGNALLVLDNAQDWHNIADRIPDGLAILVTTRTRDFGGAGFRHTELGVLSDDSAIEFLTRLIPNVSSDPSLPRLVEFLGGHALALELAAYHIKNLCSLQEYVHRLLSHKAEFSPREVAKTRYEATVEACLGITWNNLQGDASRLLWRRASLFAPLSAHRDLLRLSFTGLGSEEIGDALWELADGDKNDARMMQRELLGNLAAFADAYAELRGCHILSRVEGYNGERWAMHRLVRDYGRAHLVKLDIMIHANSLADWLRHPDLPVENEVPHFIAAILDSARERRPFGARVFQREIFHGLVEPRFYAPGFLIDFIRTELKNPRALAMILEGLADINEDVRVASIRLLENVGPIPEVLAGLASALEDPDLTVRKLAGETLASHGTEKTAEILRHAVEGINPQARLTAVRALGLMGSLGRGGLLSALGTDDEAARIEAAILLAEQGRDEGLDVIIGALRSNSTDSPGRLIRALTATKSQKVVPALCDCLEQETSRRQAADALREMGRLTQDALTALLNHPAQAVRLETAILLAEQGHSDGSHIIRDALAAARNPAEQKRLIVALAAIRDEKALPLLFESLERSEVLVHGEGVLEWIASSKDERAIPILCRLLGGQGKAGDVAASALFEMRERAHGALLELLHDPRHYPRREAAVLLAEQGRGEGIQVILGAITLAPIILPRLIRALSSVEGGHAMVLQLLDDSNHRVRLEAALVLCEQGYPEGVTAVQAAAEAADLGSAERLRCVKALNKRNVGVSTSILHGLLHDKDWNVRRDTVTFLGTTKAEGAAEKLIAALDDSYYGVRREAAVALGLIRAEEARSRLVDVSQADPQADVRRAAEEALLALERADPSLATS